MRHVEFFTKQYDKALETYQAGLKIDPANEELKDGARRCVMEQNKAASGMLTEEELKIYRKYMGKLQWLVVNCRPDLAYAVMWLSSHNHCAKVLSQISNIDGK